MEPSYLSCVLHLKPIGQNGKNCSIVDSHFDVYAYFLVLPNVIKLVEGPCRLTNPNAYLFIYFLLKFAVICNCGAQISELGDLFHRISIDSKIHRPILRKLMLRCLFLNNHGLCFLCVHFEATKPASQCIALLSGVPATLQQYHCCDVVSIISINDTLFRLS